MDPNYVFMTDSDSDLPFHLKEQYNIPVVYMPYALNGREYFDDLGQSLDYKSYYDLMRGGDLSFDAAGIAPYLSPANTMTVRYVPDESAASSVPMYLPVPDVTGTQR